VLSHSAMTEAATPRATLKHVAVVLPCLNEAGTVAAVVADFKASLPGARIYVIDNGSVDGTDTMAKLAGAHVIIEKQRGKGNAVRRAFAAIEAEIYVVVDGDGTYDAAQAPRLIEMLQSERLDMVVGSRRKIAQDAYRTGHELGNRLFNRLLKAFFGGTFEDVFSGYRILSRRFVNSFPALSLGFEIETEMTVHALTLRMPVAEVACGYRARAAGSQSKLKTYADGLRIARSILLLLRQHRPLVYFGVICGAMSGISVALFYPIFMTYLATGTVPRFPTLIVSVGLALVAALMLTCGMILDITTRTQLEIRRLIYLNVGRQR